MRRKKYVANDEDNTFTLANRQPKRKGLVGWLGLVLMVILLFTTACSGEGQQKEASYALYVKDKEVFFTDFSKQEPWQITSKFFDYDGVENGDFRYMDGMAFLFRLSKDGKMLFFPDKIVENYYSYGIPIYYRNLKSAQEEVNKIDADVDSRDYTLNDAGTIVTYRKGSNGDLYQFDLETGKKEKYGNDVLSFNVSDDGQQLAYLDGHGGFYLKSGEEKEKIDGDVSAEASMSSDFTTFYYVKDGSLYKKVLGQERIKIASNVSNVLAVYDSGEIYYVKAEKQEMVMMELIEDDLASQDAAITRPERPQSPYRWYYSNSEEYEEAYEAYKRENAAYEETYQRFQEKLKRDELRSYFAENKVGYLVYRLYYYDGVRETAVGDERVSIVGEDYTYYYNCSPRIPVVVFKLYNLATYIKPKLSEIESLSYSAEYAIRDAFYELAKQYIAVKDQFMSIEESTAKNFKVAEDGKTIIFLSNVDLDEMLGNGDLYRITISDNTIGKPELYDTDVYQYNVCFMADGKLLYQKGHKGSRGDLYLDKEQIDYDVTLYAMEYNENCNEIIYRVDYNAEEGSGTLKLYKDGNVSKIADNVYDATILSNGEVLYLYDYSNSYHRGDLYLYRNGEAEKIDEDVTSLIKFQKRNDFV